MSMSLRISRRHYSVRCSVRDYIDQLYVECAFSGNISEGSIQYILYNSNTKHKIPTQPSHHGWQQVIVHITGGPFTPTVTVSRWRLMPPSSAVHTSHQTLPACSDAGCNLWRKACDRVIDNEIHYCTRCKWTLMKAYTSGAYRNVSVMQPHLIYTP